MINAFVFTHPFPTDILVQASSYNLGIIPGEGEDIVRMTSNIF